MDEIRVATHKELSDVAEKYYGFTFRQWVFIVLTAIIVVPVYLAAKKYIGNSLASWLVVLIAGPLMSCGFLSIQGLQTNQLVKFLSRHYIYFYKPLEWKTEKQIQQEKEIAKNRKYQQVDIDPSSDSKTQKRLEKQNIRRRKRVERLERRRIRELANAKKRYGQYVDLKNKKKKGGQDSNEISEAQTEGC